jgi:hypothetical protein
MVHMVRQRVYQMAAGYEDCNDADFLRIDPALRLALGKDHQTGASQSMLSRLENDVLGNAMGLEALDGALTRSKWEPGFLTTPVGGMCILPRLFRWLITTERY